MDCQEGGAPMKKIIIGLIVVAVIVSIIITLAG